MIELTDILSAVTASDSECEELSSGDECSDNDELWELGAEGNSDDANSNSEDIHGNYDVDDESGSNDHNDGDNDDDDVRDNPKAQKNKRKSKQYQFETRRPFIPPDLPPFVPDPEYPTPDDHIPVDYVKMFITDDMLENLVLESNKYATEKTGSCPNFTKAELLTYIGIYYLMGIVRVPKIDDYWSNNLRYEQIASKMSRNRFRLIHRSLHFVDNNIASDEDKLDRVWKLRPWITKLNLNFSVISCEEFQSVDEIMVPFKGRSVLRMYLPKKPKKWGITLWGHASPGGILHAFDVYQGKGTGLDGKETDGCGMGGNVVLQLTETLPQKPIKIFADNFFTNFAMAAELKKRGLQYTGTISANCLHKAPLKSEKELSKDGRGTHCNVYESTIGLCLVRWLDNKAVTLLSTYLGSTPSSKVKRYNWSLKKHVDVDRPAVVAAYNANMGGIDLFDMMCTLYKRQIKSRRWYLYIFYHTLTMVMANAWFLYRRQSKSLKNANPLQMKEFQTQAATSLMCQGKVPRGCPSLESAPPAKRNRVQPGPQLDIRYDNVGHFPTSQEKKGRCCYCPTGFSHWTCSKCKVYLCMVCGKNPKNCFLAFHQK